MSLKMLPKFRGKIVTVKQASPGEGNAINLESIAIESLRNTAAIIQDILHRQPVITVRSMMDQLSLGDKDIVEKALPLCGYMFKNGPWQKALVKFGFDPRTSAEFRHFQTVTFDINMDPVLRPKVSHKDGFFWNGTMAKLEVIMRHKLVCIRDGGTPDDADYDCLLSFPDIYKPPPGRDYICYGREFGTSYTAKQAYMRGKMVDRARRSLGSARELSSDSSTSHKPFTKGQQTILESVGNKQIASRLYKRELTIFSKEQRLGAIEFYRTHVHVNPFTGEERDISTSSAAELLHINHSTLQRWINEEAKITAMKQGSSRDDGERYLAVPLSERFKNGVYPFLRLTLAQLSAMKYIQGEDYYKLHPIIHPVPFIGIEGGRRGRIKNFAGAYKFLNRPEATLHPGHPREPDPETIEFSTLHSQPQSLHDQSKPIPKVQEVSAQLYRLAPDYSLRQPGLEACTPCYHELRVCVQLICESLVASNTQIDEAIPVRIGFDYNQPFNGAPQHWAISLSLKTKAQTLLPLSLCLRGSVKQETVPDTLLLQGWTIDHEILKCEARKRQRKEERELNPILYVEDVEMLFSKSDSWRPRRFAPTWTLYSTILHSSYRSGDTVTPIHGRYTDIGLLVRAVIAKSPPVSFSVPAVQPFQLLSLDDISFAPQGYENILSELTNHLEITDSLPSNGLSLEFIEETLKQAPKSTSQRDYRKKLQLKLMYDQPENNWIIDFEYASMPKRYSPVPLQLAIRQLDGKLVFSCNINYNLSMEKFIEMTSSYASDKNGMMGTLFLRCYDDVRTNGKTPLQAREQILKVCDYSPERINILSWYSMQDMQCFLRILSKGNELMQDKISHQGHKNFQTVKVGPLCGKLFPGLLSTRLQSVYEHLNEAKSGSSPGDYHTASYDTEVMAAIINHLVKLA
ncbi:hypothetical protein BJY00DRAFT_322035 [Aspergillus carlsbadensis]|nr:hypothetical protein BJY00DRAFT_322035 [Aspergillus carlsbadensis]